MTGNDAAETVERMCMEAGHAQRSGPGAEPAVCAHCGKVANRLRDLHRDETPTLPITTVHFAINDQTRTILDATTDEKLAHEVARANRGLVVSWPVSADYRKADGDG